MPTTTTNSPTPNPQTNQVTLPPWAECLLEPARHKCLYGGRGSGKTWAMAHVLVTQAATQKLRVICCREFGSSIKASAKLALEVAIHRLNLHGFFTSFEQSIRGRNGSYFSFTGVERNREEIRGWEDVDRVWFEEAQRMSETTARILYPTIRKPGSEIWVSWNPKDRTDYVWRRFIHNPRPGDVIRKINWNDNPWFPDEAEAERVADKHENPDLYAHIWEGEPDDEGQERKVLPFAMLDDCVTAFRNGLWSGEGLVDVGLDVADTGDNFNALVVRRGACITRAEKWRAPIIGDTARRADRAARETGAVRLHYDAQGVGAGVRSYFADMGDREYQVRPEMFGGAVKGPDSRFSYRLSNKEFFARRNAQLGWALRLRATNTKRLLVGETIDPDLCLFIDPSIPRLDEFLAQLSQPAWRESMTGKTELLKRDEDEQSPDLYDAAVLAFATDSSRGLKQRT